MRALGVQSQENLGNIHGEAVRALTAIQAHVNPHACGKHMRRLR